MVQYVVPICAVDTRNIDIAVVYLEFESFADEPLGQFHDRAFAQIVGARFEAEPEYTHAPRAFFDDSAHRPIYLLFIARQHGPQYGQREIQRLGLVQKRTQILGKAGAAESKAR